ncbi:hypothetical protein VD659_07795 [Herbiconiux sp. 11R-BC]|uniref:hypothetical protein n=1 Tax=Herbiconiux sp. 11R-BC TaxID=3111637 RepID=UPI003C0A8A14
MKRNHGFWSAVGWTHVAGVVFVFAAFVRNVNLDGDLPGSITLAVVMFASIVPMMFVLAGGVAVVGGWHVRARSLKSDGPWHVIHETFKTNDLEWMIRHVRDPLHQLPYGLTLASNLAGVSVWSGRGTPVLQLWIPWSDIRSLCATTTVTGGNRFPSLEVSADMNGQRLRFAFPLLGQFPFRSSSATPDTLERLVADLRSLQSGRIPSGR